MNEVQLERMRPRQLDAACQVCPVAYIPFGATEYHGHHLPVGLDGLKAHGILVRAARELGGIVLPPIYHGSGGAHSEFPWTWMADADTLVNLLLSTLEGLERSGIRCAIILCGHGPNAELIDRVKQQHTANGGKLEVHGLCEWEAWNNNDEPRADHAGKWEASFLMALEDGLENLDALRTNDAGQTANDFSPPAPFGGGWWFEQRPEHPWYAVAGPDGNNPEHASRELGQANLPVIIQHLRSLVAKWQQA